MPYKDVVSFRQRVNHRPLLNKNHATNTVTTTPPDKLLQNIRDWTGSFLLQPLESWPTPRMMHLLFSILTKTQQMMQYYDLKHVNIINTSYEDPSMISLWENAQKQQQQWINSAPRFTTSSTLAKRRLQPQKEEEEEGGGEEEEEKENGKNHEDGKEGDDNRRHGSDHQDSDSQQHQRAHEEEEEGGGEGHDETREDNNERRSAKLKKRYYLPSLSSSLLLLEEIRIELDQVSDYVAHIPLHQGDLFARLNCFLALIHQFIAMVEFNNAKVAYGYDLIDL